MGEQIHGVLIALVLWAFKALVDAFANYLKARNKAIDDTVKRVAELETLNKANRELIASIPKMKADLNEFYRRLSDRKSR